MGFPLRLAAGMLLATPFTLPAQLPDTSYAYRALSRLAEKLHGDPNVPQQYRFATVAQLAGLMDTGNITGMLDDSSSYLFIRTASATLHQVPDSVCGGMLESGSDDYLNATTIFRYADSATVDDWVTLHERLIRAQSRGGSGGRAASPEEFQQAMVNLFQSLSEPDRARMMDIAQHPPPTAETMCWATRRMMDYFATLPPAEIGPISRALDRGPQAGPEDDQ